MNESIERGITDHRVVRSLEELIRGFLARGVGTNEAVRLATAHAVKMESIRWWKDRGYDVDERMPG